MFFFSKHFVIALYILEIAAASVAFAFSRLLKRQNPKQKTAAILSAIMVLRLIVKLIYFYVEFYIASWPLNIFINFTMDSTYVLSMLLSAKLVTEHSGASLRGLTTMMKVSSLFYVFLWMAIQIFFVDPSSNHIILFRNFHAEIIYTINEVFFAAVFLHAFIMNAWRLRKKHRGALAFSLVCTAYVLYVFLWDISFVFNALSFIRHSKPLDGVLLFSIGYFLFFFINEKKQIAALFSALKSPVNVVLNAKIDSSAFATAHDLTAREKEVFALLVQGHNNGSIASLLFISDNTVKRHLTSIYKKCGAKGRAHLLYCINAWNESIK